VPSSYLISIPIILCDLSWIIVKTAEDKNAYLARREEDLIGFIDDDGSRAESESATNCTVPKN
jgi:predicted carbohydrate-binding protein with CBM5 and CBM33 domain